MSAGDVYLFHRPTTWANFKADKFGTVMTALIHLTTRSRWNHASLGIGTDENGVELMVEATSKGVAVNPIESADEIRVIPIPHELSSEEIGGLPTSAFCSDGFACYWGNDREETLAVATGMVGTRYGFGNAFWCGFRHVFPGAAHVKHGKSLICSELVSLALMYAGHRWDKDTALVSPGDLAEHFGVPRR